MTEQQKRAYDKAWRDSHKEYLRKYKKDNKERFSIHWKRWKLKNPDKVKRVRLEVNLKRLYRLTPDEYDAMLLKQNGCCAICERPASEYKRKLHVDHDHTTGKNRGLLCVRCNNGLGHFKESLLLLDRAKEYLVLYNNPTK